MGLQVQPAKAAARTIALVFALAAAGAQGADSVAYAHVLGNGTLDAANSKNVRGMAGSDGMYCFKLTFIPKTALATLANDPTAPNQGAGFIETAVPPTPMFTCSDLPSANATVNTFYDSRSKGGYAFYVYWTR
jgi:hypothetical protein